jgi:predicted alpha-1,2-mannosidase
MKKKVVLLTLGIGFLSSAVIGQLSGVQNITANNGTQSSLSSQVLDYIDPTIGNAGWLLEPTRPTVHLPNQMIRFAPRRKDYFDDQITDFPLNIVSHRLGEVFSIKPSSNDVSPNSWSPRMSYDHDLEVNRPWYYSNFLLDSKITVEFTPGTKTGFFRFTFPVASKKILLFNVLNESDASWNFVSNHELTGIETYHENIKVYMYGAFSEPGKPGVFADNQVKNGSSAKGKNIKAFIGFNSSNTIIEFKYAISYVSAEQAKRNFAEEASNQNFESAKDAAMQVWQQTISKIRVEGGSVAQRRSFYTALYRCYERMVNITEDSTYYSGYNNKINRDSRPFYVDDWSWDTYLALHPLRMILEPELEENMLQSYVRMYEQSGWMPTFPVIFGDHACMNGFHSTVIFLDAYRKGLRNFDLAKAYEGMRKNAVEATLIPWQNGNKTILDDLYHEKGYFPALHIGEKETMPQVHPFEKRQAVAVTLGASYDDWALSQLAGELNKEKDKTRFESRGYNYKNLWNKEKKFFLPKDDKGEWINIDPAFDGGPGGRDYYDENNGYTYLWQVQQDIPGLVDLMGGSKAFESRLDLLFREGLGHSKQDFWYKFPDATGLVGQYSMGNEPSFHIPYLYNFTGAPWKTQKQTRFLLDTWFKDNIYGIPGDEDGGGMSAFVVFSSMGFYPITPGLPVYTIGSPVFSKVTIDLPNGKQFTLIANNSSVVNKYIQSARLNGKVLNTPWFTHEQLINGEVLELEMGPKPNEQWGLGAAPLTADKLSK